MIEKTTLDNSITVISENLPGFASASIGIWLNTGSRDEKSSLNGIAHFYEHMVFKGTAQRDSLEIVQEIESRGGHINAYTSRENTCFYAKVVAEDLKLATDILCDMINEPKLDAQDFRKEKEVILEEVRSCLDNPDDLIGDLYGMAVHAEDILGRPIAGSLQSVKKLTIADLHRYQKEVLNQHEIIIVATGSVDHQKVSSWVKNNLKHKTSFKTKPRRFKKCAPKHLRRNKDISQCIVSYGMQCKSGTRKEKIALAVLNSLLGDGMSSRLFQSVREEQGLVYSIYTACDFYDNRIGFNINFSAEHSKSKKALEITHNEIQKLITKGIADYEIEDCKNALIGNLILNTETSNSRMNRLARLYLSGNSIEGLDYTIKEIRAITKKDVEKWIPIIFQKNEWSSAAILPKGKTLAGKKWMTW
jgi:predicted Zn-dependent peptidase